MTETHVLRCSECGTVMGDVTAPTDEQMRVWNEDDGHIMLGGHDVSGDIKIRCKECSE